MHLSRVILMMLYMTLMGGVSLGLFIFWMNLPFIILGLNNAFFRERFFACLHIQSVPVTTVQAGIDGSDKQNSTQDISQENNSS